MACASALDCFHPQAPVRDRCWWGMLSTQPDRRGEKIAWILGVDAMVRMSEDSGFQKFSTGVRGDNAPSTALCAKLAVARTDYMGLVGIDPSVVSAGRMAKLRCLATRQAACFCILENIRGARGINGTERT